MSGAAEVYLLQEEDRDLFRTINDFLNSPVLAIGFRVVLLCFVVLWLALAYWTFADAGRRGTVRFFWGAGALLVPFLGTLIYLIVRPPEYLLDSRERELELAVLERELRQRVNLCPSCRSVVEKEYLLGVPPLPRVRLGSQEALRDLSEAVELGLEYLPVLRCGAERKERQLVGG